MTAATGYSVIVEACVREAQSSKFVWTLRLNGFQKGHCIYIFHISKGRITAGHSITDPTQPIVIDSWNADLFDVSKQDEYHFR